MCMCRLRKRAHSFSGITQQADTHNTYLSLPACYTGNDRIPIAFPLTLRPPPSDAARPFPLSAAGAAAGARGSVCATSTLVEQSLIVNPQKRPLWAPFLRVHTGKRRGKRPPLQVI